MRALLCLFACGAVGCAADETTPLDLRTSAADNAAIAFLDAEGRVLGVTRTVRSSEMGGLLFDAPADTEASAVFTWNDADFEAAYPCYGAQGLPQLTPAPAPDETPSSGPRVQQLRLEVPSSFSVREFELNGELTDHARLPTQDSSGVLSQVSLQVEVDTEGRGLPFEALSPLQLPVSVVSLRWLDERRALGLGRGDLTLFVPATGEVLSRVDLTSGTETFFEGLDFVQVAGGWRMVAVGSYPLEEGRHGPASYTVFVELEQDTLRIVSRGTANFGGLSSVVLTSSASFIAGGYPVDDNASIDLQRGSWDNPNLTQVAELLSIPGDDLLQTMALFEDDLYISTKQRVHFGDPINLDSQAVELPERLRIFSFTVDDTSIWGSADAGTILRREGGGAFERVPTDDVFFPPSFADCGTVDQGRVNLGRRDLRDIHWDGDNLWLAVKSCALAVAIERRTGCARVLKTESDITLRDQEIVRELKVGPGGALMVTSDSRLFFARPK